MNIYESPIYEEALQISEEDHIIIIDEERYREIREYGDEFFDINDS